MTSSVEAKACEPDAAIEVGLATLETLARTARQVALYGPRHPLAVEALARACEAIAEAAGSTPLRVQASGDGLLWNGVPLQASDGNVGRFHTAMRERLIASLEIDGLVDPSDLARLVLVLAVDCDELAAEGGAAATFGTERNTTIRLEEVDFGNEVLVSEGIWRQLSGAVDPEETAGLRKLISACVRDEHRERGASGAAPDADSSELHEETGSAQEVVATGIARLLQRAGEKHYFTDKKQWQAWRETTARQLASLSPKWRALIYRAPAGVSSEYPDMLGLVASEMEEAACVSLVLDHPDSIRAERSDMLGLALERIFADRARRPAIQAALRERALKQGVPEAVYENVVGLLLSRLEGQHRSDSQTTSVHSKIGGVDASSDDSLHESLDDLLETVTPEAVRVSRLYLLQETLDTPLSISQYGTVISLLTKATEECAQCGDVEGLLSVVRALGHEMGSKHLDDPSRRAVAASALARASTDEIVACLETARREAPEDRGCEIIELLGLLGEPGLRTLTEVAREGSETSARHAVAILLERDGPDFSHLGDVVSQARGISLERVLQSLISSRSLEASAKITAAAAGATEDGQLMLIRLISDSDRVDLAPVLEPMLLDESGTVRSAAVSALAKLGAGETVPAICRMLEQQTNFGEGARIKEAAVKALGELGKGEAVPTLSDVLAGKAFFSKLGSHRPRIAAAHALAALGGPDAHAALEQGCRSIHPAVREACRRGLARLMAAEAARRGEYGVG
ncbi:MAG: HEAT repeat domain-containing protein [Armatimonadetes bacterium]|nr:HEAT repeat domain-containing protein [Armatimonadota bacterium]